MQCKCWRRKRESRRITCMKKISAAIVVAAKHDYNGKDIVHCDIDPEKQRFKVYVTKNVVEEVEDSDTDLTFGRGPGHQEERQGGQDH